MMDNEHISTLNSELSLYGKKAVKKLQQNWPQCNYDLYKRYSELHPYVVKVTKWIGNKEIKMERLNVELTFADLFDFERQPLHPGVTKERVYRAIMFYQTLQNDFYKFSFEEMPKIPQKNVAIPGKYFYHHDLNLTNLVFNTDDYIKLIDPNAFSITNTFVNTSYVVNLNNIMWKANFTLQRLENVQI